jgi:hypothetical protein
MTIVIMTINKFKIHQLMIIKLVFLNGDIDNEV